MQLKDYQVKTLEIIKGYLDEVYIEKQDGNTKHASLDAWQDWGRGQYIERKNGVGKDIPNFCLKIPTGGGKTLLATKTIDLINTSLLKKQTGLVLWIVPTSQIYNQTIASLKDKNHSYRQFLDQASGNKTIILEKTDRFSPQDIRENLVIMMLMLPSAARKTKDVLRLFKDNGGFQSFFPPEDQIDKHLQFLEKFPNLDTFDQEGSFWGKQIKTSLGNTLKLLSPIVILDEGQKAYSPLAQQTIYNFNPSIVVELSATPLKESNVLVNILGIELKREEMIKLDLHVINKSSPDWQDTLRSSVDHRQFLEDKAKQYQQNTNQYIRPICLIQVERTGKDQRNSKFIHSEDAKEFLIKNLNIPPDQIAIKTSQKDELKEIDDTGGLMSPDCQIRYIITKQALQEGWDCPFAYVLTILTNPRSKTALTQLVGRILRQPYVKKTKVEELDESYVFCFQQNSVSLLNDIRKGFSQEGIGDLADQISISQLDGQPINMESRTVNLRNKFQNSVNKLILPIFAIYKKNKWQKLDYYQDLVSQINWDLINFEYIKNTSLLESKASDIEIVTTITDENNQLDTFGSAVVKRKENGTFKLDPVFISKQILDIVPNPWIAFEISQKTINILLDKYDKKIITNNIIFITEELRKQLYSEKNRMTKDIFKKLLNDDKIRFFFINNLGYKFPQKQKLTTKSPTLTKKDNTPLQKSLFDYIPQESFNEVEKAIAWYLEDQQQLFFWFRNIPKQDYYLQGWNQQKVYPDFIFTKNINNKDNQEVFVVESKGVHLKNEDTQYKQELFELCNKIAQKKTVSELGFDLEDYKISYRVIFDKEWQSKFNQFFT